MNARATKFLFDLDFSAPDAGRERAATPAEIARQVADAEARAYRAGYEAALHEAKVESDRRAASAFEQIGSAIQAIAARMSEVENRMTAEAVEVAVAAARQLAGELVAADPLANIESLVADCFRHLVSTPHLVIRINERLYEAAQPSFEHLAKQSGFQGRLIVLAEPDIEAGDCRIEWADGGVVRERAAIDARIIELVRTYLASRGQAETGTQS
jgi:flagellar assembly protein FliH